MSRGGPRTAPDPGGSTTAAQPTPPTRPQLREEKRAPDWDRTISRSPDAGLLQSWRWGEFKGRSGWSPLRLVLEAGAGQTLAAGQILFRSRPRLPIPISIAYVPRGPVLFDRRGERAFWGGIHKESRRRGAIFLKVEPPIVLGEQSTKGEVDREMAARGFRPAGRLQPARTIVLDLEQSEDELLKAMKPKTRYNIRLAGRRGVEVKRASTLGELRAFYSLLEVTSERDEFGIHTFQYYRELWDTFGPGGDNSALLLTADHPDEAERAQGPIAGLLALKFGREAIYMYGASANRGREHMPTYLLQWEAIRWARGEGCRIYDFWGIPDPPSEEGDEEVSPTNTRSGLRGVYWFKKGFGGREVEYPGAYDYVYRPLLYKVWMRWRGANLG
jgi:lipid II:glycine glycyltransferase (peptidoglycan interpeptide bridge formation enzyme)